MSFRILGEPWKTLGGLFGGILGSGPRSQLGVDFLFRDDFITAEAALLTSPRTAEPGPGIGTLFDSLSVASISGGAIQGIATANGDPNYHGEAIARIIGLACMGINYNGQSGGFVGFDSNAITVLDIALSINAGTVLRVHDGASFVNPAGTVAASTNYDFATILRNQGAFYLARGGTEFLDWTLIWVGATNNNDPVYPGLAWRVGLLTLDSLRVSQLPSPWDTDFGIATDRLAGARSAGDTFTHEADCLIEFEVTTVGIAPGQNDILFRIQDATNYWRARAQPDGNFILAEVVAGVPTNRGNAGLGTVNNGDRCVIICDDETIRGYVANVLVWTYALAANFKTETDGRLDDETTGGSVSDIVAWPRFISGTARRALDRVANA